MRRYDIDAEWFRRSCCSDFGVRDASGVALVELREAGSTFVQTRRLPIEGDVERWLDEQLDGTDEPMPAYPADLRLRRIQSGDRVLLVGRAQRENDGVVFRAHAGDPSSLFVADGSREEMVEQLGSKVRRTRALFVLGAALVIAGVAAILV